MTCSFIKQWPWYLLSAVVVGLDQISKVIAYAWLIAYQPHPVMPMLNWTLAYNTGAAFSFLSTTGVRHAWLLTGFSLVMSGVLCVWLGRVSHQAKRTSLAICLVLGGAVGNLIDRIRLGYVVDFIDVHYGTMHWPVFNLADAAICIGALLLILTKAPCEKTNRPSSPLCV